MTDQAKEEYLVPGAKVMFHSALERKIEIFTKRARNYLRLFLKSIYKLSSQGLHYEMTLNDSNNILLIKHFLKIVMSWFDYESGLFWAEKTLALSIENYNLTCEPNDKIKPFQKGKLK